MPLYPLMKNVTININQLWGTLLSIEMVKERKLELKWLNAKKIYTCYMKIILVKPS